MYFRRLEMQGFKSFAEKTVLEFGDGITAVVGPNGSGKSNISDAIRWVLGEQSPKSLRGGKMEDVIFSGTENRKQVSFAEVSIIMDNSDGALNIDYDTVKVTRRLFRSGESEYLINGQKSKLKDINLLFADTGIGKEGYSIIGQGKVDEILSNKSEDRRGIFEEASGIMKYRLRKQESERKLQLAEQNLVVVDGIITELELQVNTLKKQAISAEQYLKLKYELRDIEVGVLVQGITEAEEKLKEIKEKYDAVVAEISENETQVEKVRKENETATNLSAQLENDYNQAKEGSFESSKQATELRSEIALNNQKIENAKAEILRMETENKEKTKQAEQKKKQIKELEEEQKQIVAELRVLDNDVAKEQRMLDIVISAISGGSKTAQDKNKQYVDSKLLIERLKNQMYSFDSQSKFYQERVSDIEKEITASKGEKENAEKSLLELKDKYDTEKSSLEKMEKIFQASCDTRDDLEAEIEEKTARVSDLKTAIDTCEAQLKLLREMEENFEGYANSVKEILTLCRDNPKFGKGIYGAVAQVITVEKNDEAAIEVALGNTFQDIITEDEDSAKLAIEYLKTNKLGRATFLPLTAVSPKYMESDHVDKLCKINGYVGIAADLVKYEPMYENVVQSLLGKVAVFENIDAAIFAAKQSKYSFMCVTREGDILRTSGAITGGSPEKGRRGGALSRTREIPEYEKLLESGKKKYDRTISELGSCKDQLNKENQAITELAGNIKQAEISVARLSTELSAKQSVFDTLKGKEDQLKAEIEKQNELIDSASSGRKMAADETETLEKTILSLETELSSLEEEAKELNGEKDRRQNIITQLKLKQADFSGRNAALNSELERLSKDISSENDYKETIKTQRENAEKLGEELSKKNVELQVSLEEQDKKKNEFDKKCLALYEQKKDTDTKVRTSFETINTITERLGFLREESARIDSRRMRYEHDYDYNKARLWDEYELTFSKAYEITDGKAPDNLEEAKKRIVELRNGIKKLGNVNVESIEDLKTTSERYEFTVAQRKDVIASVNDLRKIVDELESKMKKQFAEQFETIRENFRVVFQELFGGGKADIVLSDESNCLDCGIEINAQPPGKKLQNMLLLSGGEKALTAIALLFGILKMRPTPFCMLDEIESALDDANVYRFARYTKSLSKETQLILVTHRKGTMESADSLYGVTMEEKGVSKVVSVKL